MENLGRFNHHPDPATDFCDEVDNIVGMAYDVSVGLASADDLRERMARAMQFKAVVDPYAVHAKEVLRELVATFEREHCATYGACIDALRQWQAAERGNDESEISNARTERDRILSKCQQ